MFDTFNLLEGLSIGIVMNKTFPKSIWKILNHLQYHFKIAENNLDNLNHLTIADEDESWINAEVLSLSEEDLLDCLKEVKRLIKVFENRLERREMSVEMEKKKREVLEETALHFAFHLGEIALIRRCLKDYLNHEEANIQYLNEKQAKSN